LARDREQHLACELFGYRKDSNEAAFTVAAVEKIYAHELLTFNNTVACEVITKWKDGLKDDMDARSDVYMLSNDDMIKENLALKEQVDSLEQSLSRQIKEKECLLQTFTVFKRKFKEKEDKNIENEIDLEKRLKELDNIIFKVGQSAYIVYMLTKPQVFYDNIHKETLGYQNLFYLKKAQQIKPTLYDGIVISAKHVAMHVIDDKETLILEEESR
nr:zinc finger, CCHC-type [Tanacetum cinerariifolium]